MHCGRSVGLNPIPVSSRPLDDQRVTVCVILDPEAAIVQITQVYAAAHRFVDLRSQRDRVSWDYLTALVLSSGKCYMCQMRGDAEICLELARFATSSCIFSMTP